MLLSGCLEQFVNGCLILRLDISDMRCRILGNFTEGRHRSSGRDQIPKISACLGQQNTVFPVDVNKVGCCFPVHVTRFHLPGSTACSSKALSSFLGALVLHGTLVPTRVSNWSGV